MHINFFNILHLRVFVPNLNRDTEPREGSNGLQRELMLQGMWSAFAIPVLGGCDQKIMNLSTPQKEAHLGTDRRIRDSPSDPGVNLQ